MALGSILAFSPNPLLYVLLMGDLTTLFLYGLLLLLVIIECLFFYFSSENPIHGLLEVMLMPEFLRLLIAFTPELLIANENSD